MLKTDNTQREELAEKNGHVFKVTVHFHPCHPLPNVIDSFCALVDLSRVIVNRTEKLI